MKMPYFTGGRRRTWLVALLLASLSGILTTDTARGAAAPFGVPVRLSFKFILNGSGSRSATGNINTDEEVEAQVERGNAIFSRWISELRFHNVEIVNLAGVSQWYLATTDDLGALRTAALADPTTYRWRTDAVNIYISGGGGSGVSYGPSWNQIVLVCQGLHDTTVAHELGHILNVNHTHSGQSDACTNCAPACAAGALGADGCTDTIQDTTCWDQNEISQNAYGKVYSLLNASQQYQVNMVWSNLMSYHNVDYRSMLSPCQLNIQSTQASDDQTWLLTKRPIYVDAGYAGTHTGTFTQPYQTIQQAITAGVINGRVLVLDTGTHANPTSVIQTDTDVVPRKGTAIVRDAPPKYLLPYAEVEDSANPAVRNAVLRAQQAAQQKDLKGVLANLLEAEQNATGRERDAIRTELAQRYRDSQQFEEAEAWFQKVAAEADQPALRQRSMEKAGAAKAEAEKLKREQAEQESDENNQK